MAKILIADDSETLRTELREVLEGRDTKSSKRLMAPMVLRKLKRRKVFS